MTEVVDIAVLVVEASDSLRGFLVQLLQADPRIRVVQAVEQPQAALNFLQTHRASLVLVAHGLPELDGFDTTRRIMENHPLPVVLCAQAATADDVMVRSLEAGAVACVEKPTKEMPTALLSATTAHLLQTVKLMSEVKVVRRWARAPRGGTVVAKAVNPSDPHVVGIGASTGGPHALQTILAALPSDFPVPILAVQHIAKGFLQGMADWLSQTSGPNVVVGTHDTSPQPGHVYLAPDGFHMGYGPSGRIVLGRESAENGLQPSVAYLFRSLADYCGTKAVGVLLTGMGKDGAYELKRMRDAGATTIVQDSASSVVHGMPGEAIALGAAMHVAPVGKIADLLISLTRP